MGEVALSGLPQPKASENPGITRRTQTLTRVTH